jgi:hypothetical protein
MRTLKELEDKIQEVRWEVVHEEDSFHPDPQDGTSAWFIDAMTLLGYIDSKERQVFDMGFPDRYNLIIQRLKFKINYIKKNGMFCGKDHIKMLQKILDFTLN